MADMAIARRGDMGEVHVRVKLTNAVDQALVRRGLLQPEQVRTDEADALVDTGAVRCVLPPHVAQRLGLEVVGRRVAEYADGRLEAVGLRDPLSCKCLTVRSWRTPWCSATRY